MSSRWTVEDAQVAHATPYFRVIRAQVTRPDGSRVDYHTVDFPRPAVAIVLQDDVGRVLLVRQQRFIVDRDVWALPSGGVEDGEPLAAAAARELEEETGLCAAELSHLLSFYPSYGVSNQVFHCFFAAQAEPRRAFDRNEVEDTAWFTPAELRALIAAGDIPDGFSLVPLLQLLAGVPAQDGAQAHRCRVVSLLERP